MVLAKEIGNNDHVSIHISSDVVLTVTYSGDSVVMLIPNEFGNSDYDGNDVSRTMELAVDILLSII